MILPGVVREEFHKEFWEEAIQEFRTELHTDEGGNTIVFRRSGLRGPGCPEGTPPSPSGSPALAHHGISDLDLSRFR